MPKISIKCSGNFDILQYSFGMELEGRTYCSSGYRHGFNGQNKDNEIYGEGNTYSAQYWEYDARLGRRWNLDPKPNASISETGNITPNSYAAGYADPNGVEIVLSEIYANENGIAEEFFHNFQMKFYNPKRKNNALESEAKLFTSIVNIQTQTDNSNTQQILDKMVIENVNGLLMENGNLFTTFMEMNKSNCLLIENGTKTFDVFSNQYLKSFEMNTQNTGAGYSGVQQQLEPNAYNEIINKQK